MAAERRDGEGSVAGLWMPYKEVPKELVPSSTIRAPTWRRVKEEDIRKSLSGLSKTGTGKAKRLDTASIPNSKFILVHL